MTHQRCQWLFPADVPDVDFAVFAAAGDEALVDASEAGIDGIATLGNSLKATHQTFILEIP